MEALRYLIIISQLTIRSMYTQPLCHSKLVSMCSHILVTSQVATVSHTDLYHCVHRQPLFLDQWQLVDISWKIYNVMILHFNFSLQRHWTMVLHQLFRFRQVCIFYVQLGSAACCCTYGNYRNRALNLQSVITSLTSLLDCSVLPVRCRPQVS